MPPSTGRFARFGCDGGGGGRNGRMNVDWVCLGVGYVSTAWWLVLLTYSSLPSASLIGESPGEKLKMEGLRALHPVVLVPGTFAGDLELWQGKPCAEDLFRQRLWGGAFARRIFKRAECWMEHMRLDNGTGLDPPGVRVRAVHGLAAAPSFAHLIRNLAHIGYEDKDMYLAAYDWRLSFHNTEVRDQSLSRLKSQIELMVRASGGRKVVVVPYSMGALYFLHFLKWVEAPPSTFGGGGGSSWCSQHIKAVMNIGSPFLGFPKAMTGILSDEPKDIASLIWAMSHGDLDPNVHGFQAQQHIMHVSRTWDSIHYALPKGGDAIWGGKGLSIKESFECELRNKKNAMSLLRDRTSPSNGTVGKGGFSIGMLAHYARIIFFKGITPLFSLELPHADSKKLLIGSTFLQMKSSQEEMKAVSSEIDGTIRTTSVKNNAYISSTIHDLLCFVAPMMAERAHAHISHGMADDLDEAKYTHYKYWSNPLEMRLPDAPDVEMYCLYGVDTRTKEANENGDDENGVPLVSAGFMCAKGWRGRTRFNPSGIRTYVREYTNINKTPPNFLIRKSDNARVNILGNSALIEDILRVAAGASGYQIGGDKVHSTILSISDQVKFHSW